VFPEGGRAERERVRPVADAHAHIVGFAATVRTNRSRNASPS